MQINGLPPRLADAMQAADARTKAQGIEPDDTDPRWNETLAAEFAKAMREDEPPTAHGPRIRSHSDLDIARHNADPDCPDCGGAGRYALKPEDCSGFAESLARGEVACECTEPASLDHEPDGWRDPVSGDRFDDVLF